ncbi:hypothetical protein KC332_g14740 [Hortaea werneckii]|nr:hypothetical protein KC358_g14395 [Hortaea werneckii]KAI6806478.1 hypothetical protein KC350_g14145 [Hortaea werneckii]KAI6903709.1 hypothetical protein KC348_g15582 [Hortaea werneckii]KAI6924373.1 hypothetical protein KC341_g14101 [Hortaea werneckii]KAI6957963.1 hypothetical protein KC321_g14278 [Hortaea werneckii]
MSSTLSPSPSTSLPQTQTQPQTKSLLRTHLKTHILASLPEESLASQSLRAQDVILTQLPAWQQAQRVSIYLSMPTGEARTEGIVRAALGEGKAVFVPVLCPEPALPAPLPREEEQEGREGSGLGGGKQGRSVGDGSGSGGGSSTGRDGREGGDFGGGKPRPKRRRMRMEMLRLNSLEEFERLERDAWGIPSLPAPSLAGRENARGGFGPEGRSSRPGEEEEEEEGVEGKSRNGKDVEGEGAGLDLIVVPGVAFDRDMARMGHGAGFYDGYLTRLVTEGRHKKPFLVGLCLAEQVLEPGRIVMEEWDWRVDAVATGDGRLLTADGGA